MRKIYVTLAIFLLSLPAAYSVEVVAGFPSSVGRTAANLTFMVLASNDAAEVNVNYGLDENNLNFSTPVRQAPSSSVNSNFSEFISELTCGTTYFYQATANAAGLVTTSDVVSFMTNACVNTSVVVEAQDAQQVTKSSARIYGTIDLDRNYASAKYFFEFGQTAEYGQRTVEYDLNTRITNQRSVNSDLFNLSCESEYHYRLVLNTTSIDPDTQAETISRSESGNISFTTLACDQLEVLDVSLISITDDSASVTVSVNTNNIATTVFFQSGNSATLGVDSESIDVTDGSLTYVFKDLECGVPFYFNAVISNGVDTIISETQFYNTRSCVVFPDAITLDATQITKDSAVLRATIFPNDTSTSVDFDYGESNAMGLVTDTKIITGGFTGQIVEIPLTGLVCSTLYYYQANAENLHGKKTGVDESFSTMACGDPTEPTVPVTDSAGKIISGSAHSIAIGVGGEVVTWGDNTFGQLGGLTTGINVIDGLYLSPNELLINVIDAAAGDRHTLILKNTGNIYSFGDNGSGQLGSPNSMPDSSKPVFVVDETGREINSVTKVAAGSSHSVALTASGSVLGWGDNRKGQVGLADVSSVVNPVMVSGISNAEQVAAGGDTTIVLMPNGTLMGWGSNEWYQLGETVTPTQASPVSIPGIDDVASLSIGARHVIAVRKTGFLVSWGSNEKGQLGIGSNSTSVAPTPVRLATGELLGNVKQISAGTSHSVVLLNDGTLLAWGDNSRGQLGVNDMDDHNSPVPVTGADGNPMQNFSAISAGDKFTVALKNDGTLLAWGDNVQRQLNGQLSASISQTILRSGTNAVISLNSPRIIPGINRLEFNGPDSINLSIRLSSAPQNNLPVSAEITSGSEIFTISSETEMLFNGSNWQIEKFLTLQIAESAAEGAGELRIAGPGLGSVAIELVYENQNTPQLQEQVVGSIGLVGISFLIICFLFRIRQQS